MREVVGMAVRQHLSRAMRSAARAAMVGTVNGLLERLVAWAVTPPPYREMQPPGLAVSAAACSLGSRGQAAREVLLKPRLEPLPAGLADRAGSM